MAQFDNRFNEIIFPNFLSHGLIALCRLCILACLLYTSFLGTGKAKEVGELAENLSATLIVFDNELSPAQTRNLEDVIGVRVIDRSTLILDIFASRAATREGKLQVELAQYKYILPRLTGRGIELSRLGGGIGTRGPGESKLETDRRHIHRHIAKLREELADVRKNRSEQRRARIKREIPLVAIVGYTNARCV